MRARNIKPGFFQNEALAELAPETRLLFIGLWCSADREGRLEDRPKRLKMQIFPADNFDVDPMLDDLTQAGLIVRYSVDGAQYIEIPKFSEHQRPHPNEKESTIPPQGAKDLQPRCEPLGADIRNPDIRNDDVLIPDKPTARSAPFDFDDLKSIYPKRAGDQGWAKALRACNARIRSGEDWETILAGARRYRAYCDATGKTGSEYVKQAASFCGPDKHYLQPWDPPPNKGDLLIDRNVTATREWLDGTH